MHIAPTLLNNRRLNQYLPTRQLSVKIVLSGNRNKKLKSPRFDPNLAPNLFSSICLAYFSISEIREHRNRRDAPLFILCSFDLYCVHFSYAVCYGIVLQRGLWNAKITLFFVSGRLFGNICVFTSGIDDIKFNQILKPNIF